MKVITCIAPVNIAVIKYWGKRDEDLILPINDSISSTLNTSNMCAKTTVMASPTFEESKFWLNGVEETFNNERLLNCLQEIKRRAKQNELLQWNIRICSENNFPTGAGLASSAAGYACLVSALSALYGIDGDISAIARRGSGSACRSIYGGWVQWHKGQLQNGQDSIATQIAPASHWPEMRIIVLVVKDTKKKCSSTAGMRRTVETSPLVKHRAETIVPQRVEEMTKAIKGKKFEAFAKLTMQDSNQFHSVCLDTYPPCVYMNDTSHAISEMVHVYNAYKGAHKLAYTFDAGPNACLYLLEWDVAEVLAMVNYVFPHRNVDVKEYFRGNAPNLNYTLKDDLKMALDSIKHEPGSFKYIIQTSVGEGPEISSSPSDHLLTDLGLPRKK